MKDFGNNKVSVVKIDWGEGKVRKDRNKFPPLNLLQSNLVPQKLNYQDISTQGKRFAETMESFEDG